jgi:hypothetical protein
MARWIGWPVARSQMSEVSRWLVMPMPARSAAVIPAAASASRQVASVVCQISSGSCSTQPFAENAGKLLLADAGNRRVITKYDGATGGRALIDGENERRHRNLRSLLRDDAYFRPGNS